MSAYTDFVREHIRSAPGATQKEKMRNVAAMWRKHKGGKTQAGKGALLQGGCCDEPKQSGNGARKHKSNKSKLVGGSGKRVAAAEALFEGGMVDLRPANEVGVQGGQGILGDLFPPARLFGLGADEEDMDGGKVSFNDVVNGIGSVAKTAGALAPLAMLLL